MVEICDVALETLEVLKYFNTEFTSKISESFLNSLKELAKKSKLEVKIDAIFEENYGLKEFCKNVVDGLDTRCQDYCYPVRLEQTAKYAKKNGFDTISTTLLVSPYQKHDIIHNLGNRIAKEYGLEFLYRDFRVGFREGQAKAREIGLYMQKYCGCVFSEEERYAKQIKRDLEK